MFALASSGFGCNWSSRDGFRTIPKPDLIHSYWKKTATDRSRQHMAASWMASMSSSAYILLIPSLWHDGCELVLLSQNYGSDLRRTWLQNCTRCVPDIGFRTTDQICVGHGFRTIHNFCAGHDFKSQLGSDLCRTPLSAFFVESIMLGTGCTWLV